MQPKRMQEWRKKLVVKDLLGMAKIWENSRKQPDEDANPQQARSRRP